MINRKVTSILIALSVLLTTELFAQSDAMERMRRVVTTLSADSLGGRGSGTNEEYRAARFIENRFKEEGVELLYPHPGQDFSIISDSGDTLSSQNVVAIVEGWDSQLKNQYILVGAHYDHLGYYYQEIDGKRVKQIYRGADANASGVALLLELARLVREQSFNFRRTILFVAFGAEELGSHGSWYFANRAFAPTPDISLMINLDMVGRGDELTDLSVYTTVPNPALSRLLHEASEMPLMSLPQIVEGDYFSSDHRVFASLGIPTALFTTKLHSDYHSLRDTPDKLNYRTMEHLSNYLLHLVKLAANSPNMLPKTVLSDEYEEGRGEVTSGEPTYLQRECDTQATFLKGDERKFLNEWIYKYLRYPPDAVAQGIEGEVTVTFIIESDGRLTSIGVNEDAHSLLAEEAVRVISASPKWKPAKRGRKAVRVEITLPVLFKLERR